MFLRKLTLSSVSGELWSEGVEGFHRVDDAPNLVPGQLVIQDVAITSDGYLYDLKTKKILTDVKFEQAINQIVTYILYGVTEDYRLYMIIDQITGEWQSEEIKLEDKIKRIVCYISTILIYIDENDEWKYRNNLSNESRSSKYEIPNVELPKFDEIGSIRTHILTFDDKVIDLKRKVEIAHPPDTIDAVGIAYTGIVLLLTRDGEVYQTVEHEYGRYHKSNGIFELLNRIGKLIRFVELCDNVGVIDSNGTCYRISRTISVGVTKIPREVFKIPSKMKRAIR